MESVLANACKIKIQNFEGPFDLLFHLIEKNEVNIYDIPISAITDQYMEYLFAMQKIDLEIASEFLVMAATLLQIKSRMLLPDKKESTADENDPREELVTKLIEYKKYKEFSQKLKEREKEWEKVYYKYAELLELEYEKDVIELSPDELKKIYTQIICRNMKKVNKGAAKITQIIEHEKISLRSKIREIIRTLINRPFFKFSELFPHGKKSKTEIITGFMAVLELAKIKKAKIEQKNHFDEIFIYRN